MNLRRANRTTLAATALIVGLLVWHVVEALRSSPDFLAYFNQLGGGPDQGHEHLVDSSLDWGQDLPGLKQWLDENGLQGPNHPPVYLAYFGRSFPSYYHIDAVDLPSFTHPVAAAYVLGAEQDSLSPALQERCDFIVKIPTKFCVNLAVAGAIVMYDRMISLGRFAERPVRVGGPQAVQQKKHRHGLPIWKKNRLKALGNPE